MTGERWPDKRARAVLYAGANKIARDHAEVDPDGVADLGLAVREALFSDDEVREDTVDAKAHQIGYSADCMQFAILQPAGDGVLVSLWVGPDLVAEATDELRGEPDPNPFRKLYGWIRCPVRSDDDLTRLTPWIPRVRQHAASVKTTQAQPGL